MEGTLLGSHVNDHTSPSSQWDCDAPLSLDINCCKSSFIFDGEWCLPRWWQQCSSNSEHVEKTIFKLGNGAEIGRDRFSVAK